MHLYKTIAALQTYLRQQSPSEVLALVPTMGSLHGGHLRLIELARQQNDRVVVSIFVNPLQFGPNEDLATYPRNLEGDWELCQQAGVDVVFAPTPEVMGIGAGSRAQTLVIPPESMTSVLCGQTRTGHFQGVATIVTKLFNVVRPHRAYFGQKDAQQLAIIRQLVKDLNLGVEIIGVPTVREASGLAMSSRNQYLSGQEREQASVLYRGLQGAEQAFKNGDRTREGLIGTFEAIAQTMPNVQIEYADLVDPQTLEPLQAIADEGLLSVAARVGSTRLIDNIILRDRRPIIAIDGPAGAGKSTIARQVAQNLGLLYLDTGAMYRAVTWLVQQAGIALTDEPAILELVSDCEIRFDSSLGGSPSEKVYSGSAGGSGRVTYLEKGIGNPSQIFINNQNVTEAIRSLEVTSQVSAIASLGAVRQKLVEQQRLWGKQGGLVAEGRDIGTHVFPDADLKIFLTASVEERAKRRQRDYFAQSSHASQTLPSTEQLEQAIRQRDYTDSNREIAPLQKSPEAIEIITDNLSIKEVTHKIIALYESTVLSLN
ncbi:bifunctional pantoate--beta-alanine ligase/(d)CMP kinase [Roseofilum sp. BLCC_M91]|uniref:Bifunctional pantoate ligase/cytidylate kinase n=1 Tax=Roseofilum halophilum BLCC-M91 TaxID=3022259 RepID=A0ABT7BE81_9CYAN|nr:bifunctional pantoate--beta-alanine ligase/(d)CMP kinase [Roseofilum halophilum]MDJ1177494.1 bifunctional pantoate--beta-alanine ligase/(d)CMP kinase [Roseofilum halophilum BLCC-M91]